MNFRKTIGSSGLLMGLAALMFGPGGTNAGAFASMPMPTVALRDLMLPGTPYLPQHRRNCIRHGGPSKRRRGLIHGRRVK